MVGVQILGVWVLIFSIPIDWPEIKGIIFHFPSEKPMKMIGMVFKVSLRKCVIVFKACSQPLRFERGKAHLSVHFSSSLKKIFAGTKMISQLLGRLYSHPLIHGIL